MFRNGFVCLLFASIALAQSSSPAPVLKPRPAAPAKSSEAAGESSSAVAPDAPVITVQGLCGRPVGGSATPSDCKTVITRAEFEKIVNAVQPNMPAASKKQFANRYVTILVLAEKAHELGLDHGADFDQQMYLLRLQVLAKLVSEQMQKEATNISDGDIDSYYREHASDYKAISFDRLYVPKQKQVDTSTQKQNDPDAQKKREESEAAMKELADKLRARAAAGEDFGKLQQEAYDAAGSKQKATSTRTDNVRKANIPATDVSIFELKKGEVSPVFADPAGFMIYKVEEITDLPVSSVHDEIARTLQSEKMKSSFESLQNSAKTTLDDAYFAAPAPPTLRNPGENPAAATPAPGKK